MRLLVLSSAGFLKLLRRKSPQLFIFDGKLPHAGQFKRSVFLAFDCRKGEDPFNGSFDARGFHVNLVCHLAVDHRLLRYLSCRGRHRRRACSQHGRHFPWATPDQLNELSASFLHM